MAKRPCQTGCANIYLWRGGKSVGFQVWFHWFTVRSALIYSDPEASRAPISHARKQKQAEIRPLTSWTHRAFSALYSLLQIQRRLTTWFLSSRGVSTLYIHPVYKLQCTSVHSVPTKSTAHAVLSTALSPPSYRPRSRFVNFVQTLRFLSFLHGIYKTTPSYKTISWQIKNGRNELEAYGTVRQIIRYSAVYLLNLRSSADRRFYPSLIFQKRAAYRSNLAHEVRK
jgi:hypothetical protein